MSLPSLVIFDCDGVLVDSEIETNTVLVANLARHGLELTIEQAVELFVGGTMAGVADRVRSMGYALPQDWTDLIYEEVFDHLKQGVNLVDGIWDVLDRLDADAIPYCVGSNGPIRKMEITLRPSGLWQRVEGRIFSPHVIGMENAKPAPGLFLHAAEAMGVAPGETVVIEDSFSGAQAARAAGMRCFGYCANTPQDRLEMAGATPFEDMADLPQLLGMA